MSGDPIGDLREALPPLVVPTMFVPEGQALATASPGERRRILCRPEDADRIRAAVEQIYREAVER